MYGIDLMRLLFALAILVPAKAHGQNSADLEVPVIAGPIHIVYALTLETEVPTAKRRAKLAEFAKSLKASSNHGPANTNRGVMDHPDRPVVEYWGDGATRSSWNIQTYITRSVRTDGTKWISAVADGPGTTIYYSPLNWNSSSNSTENLAFDSRNMVPFLGFQQAGKEYGNAPLVLEKVQTGWQGRSVGASAEPDDRVSILSFDQHRNLVRFERQSQHRGSFSDVYEYSDFVRTSNGKSIPGTVVHVQNKGDREGIHLPVEVYSVVSMDEKDIDEEVFSIQHPAQGARIVDFRFLNNGIPVSYEFDGMNAVDQESKLHRNGIK